MKKQNYKHRYAMLIDDNDLDNFINQKMLESNLFAQNIYINTSCLSALEFLNNILRADAAFFPEVIFIDLNMPIMDGFQFIQTLFKNDASIADKTKLVILTTSLNPADKEKAKDFSDKIVFLNKPLNDELLSQI